MIVEKEEAGGGMIFSKTISTEADTGGSIMCRERTTGAAGALMGTRSACSRTIPRGKMANAGVVWMTVKGWPQDSGCMELIRGTLQSPLPVRSGFRPRSGTWPIIPEPWPNCLRVKVLKTVVGGSVVYVAKEQQKN